MSRTLTSTGDRTDRRRISPEAVAEWSRELTVALETEADAARRLRELAERQREFIETGRFATARALMQHRRTLVADIGAQEERVRLVAAAGARADDLPAPVLEELRRLQRTIREDLQAVARRDASDAELMGERRDEAGAELGRLAGGRRAHRAYGGSTRTQGSLPGATPAPRFGDERA